MLRIKPGNQIRLGSTLADKLRSAASGDLGSTKVSSSLESVKDGNGEEFRELFVIPKRKLRGQMQIEHATGRTAVIQRSRMDLHDRLAVRNDRSRDMDPSQDWSDVWPAARTFSASVVPLPIRMGSRPNPDKRAPFKKHGNLELVKIPNFLHLTPAAIEKHCQAIKKFCTEYPKELNENKSLIDEAFPISLSYNNYVHQGTNIRDNRSRVVTMTIKADALKLNDQQKEKLIRLCGQRYNPESGMITIITDRCHTRQQNIDYAYYLLTVLYHESKKVESWESLKERVDNLKVEFDGSACKENLVKTIQKAIQQDHLNTPLKSLGSDAKEEEIVNHPKVQDFARLWADYKNKEETVESTREYAKQMRELLGIPAPDSKESTRL